MRRIIGGLSPRGLRVDMSNDIRSELQRRYLFPEFNVVHEGCSTPSHALYERDLLEGIDHSEALLVLLGHYCVARPVDNQRLHARGNSSLNFLDIVTEEQDRLRGQLKHQVSAQTTLFRLRNRQRKKKKEENLTSNSPEIFS